MNVTKRHLASFGAGVLLAALVGSPAIADDTELFLGDASQQQGQPNILFILDNSGSMLERVLTRAAYDPTITYLGGCVASRVYYASYNAGIAPAAPPACAGDERWIDKAVQYCDSARIPLATAGTYTDRMGQFGGTANPNWLDLVAGVHSQPVECQRDSGLHGNGINKSAVYARNGVAATPWSSNAADVIAWGARRQQVLYTGNYVNWWYNGPTPLVSKLNVLKDVSTKLLDSITGVNVGLMTFNYQPDAFGLGGSVVHEVSDIESSRASLESVINGLQANTATPLSETLAEAAVYFMGQHVEQGTNSVPASRLPSDPDTYKSPIEYSCQKNFIVLLTDGQPVNDEEGTALIPTFHDSNGTPFADLVDGGVCDTDTYPDGLVPGGGECLDDLAEFLNKGDLSDKPGQQNVTTFTVGFGIDLPVLQETAERGGGEYRTSGGGAALATTLSEFVHNILKQQSTFAAPAVSIDSMNRTRNLNDLYISMFAPTTQVHWPGNLKKYRLSASDGQIVDANGNPAIDHDSGFFAKDSVSLWSTSKDPSVEQGGAAHQLPPPAARKVYTWLDGNPKDLTNTSNSVDVGNTAIDDALLNIGQVGDPPREELIKFIRGYAQGADAARYQMGDPLHSQPVTVIYDGSDDNSGVVYLATNDGYLHAINANNGVEEWSFIPEEFLGKQADLYENPGIVGKRYGIDGALRVQMLVDNDEVIEPGTEKVYLIFGMRRGGTSYYALDVTNRNNPKLLWHKGSADLVGNGQSWSNPVPARINVDRTPEQSADKLVVVFGGGYDETQDGYDNAIDTNGNAIYIVDTETGDLLWHGSKSIGDKTFADMDSSFPADIRVVDFDGDGFSDRMYAADMGGRIWRFDVRNGEDPADLITGGVFAELGAAPLPADNDPTDGDVPAEWKDGPDNRRFYYAPDVALVSHGGSTFVHVGIGSGYRAHPLSTVNQDRFYALRDYDALRKLTDEEYANLEPITNDDLTPITSVDTTVPSDSKGWYLDLATPGEKVLAEARTFNNQIYFTTFVPDAGGAGDDPCTPAPAMNRLYVVNLFNAAPVTNFDTETTELTATDRYKQFPGTITSEVVFLFPSPDDPEECVGDECTPEPLACVDLFCVDTGFGNNPVRTFWSEKQIE